MRYKFRGKRLDNGEWVYGFLTCYTEKVSAIQHWNEKGHLTGYGTDPESVGQWTGLVDRHGKEIFEGDVMVCRQYIGGNFIDYCIERGFVEMLHGAFGLHRKQGYYRPFKDWLEAYEYEIIGNIYENPELLK